MSNTQLPNGWLTIEVGEIADVVSGGTPIASDSSNFAKSGTDIAWLTPADLSGYKRKSISYGARDITRKGYNSSSAKLMPKGSILFSSRAPIGYVAISENEISTNQGFKSFIFSSGVSSDYSYYYFRSIKDIAESVSSGTTFKELSGSAAKKLPFILLPLAEQKEIATLLDNLLAQVDTLKTRLDAIPNILKRFRQSVLAAAVSGKLTEEWRINKIHKTIEVRKISDELFEIGLTHGNFGKKFDRAPTIESDELKSVVKHINNWSLVRIGEICKCIVPNRDKPQTFSGGYHWLLTPHFHENSININYKNIEKGLNNEEILKYKAKVIEEKSVIMTCVGRVGLSAVLKEKAVINQQLHAFIPNDYVMPEYIAYCIRANKTYFEEKATSTTVSYLNKTACNSLPIPLASIEEQEEIVRRVEELFAFADQIEQRVKVTQQRVNHLTQAILAKAFRGELTAEWREQNPELISGENSAAALLARIQASNSNNVKASRHSK